MARRMSEQRTEQIVARVLADPYTHEMNTDGGAAAAGFIREAAAGLDNPAPGTAEWRAKHDAAQARWRGILAELGR
jgi:hypothetical protein